jgi:hypothetical protein
MVKKYRIKIIILLVLCFTVLTSKAQSPEELVKRDWPNLYNDYGKLADKEPANFIFVIDISEINFGPIIRDQIQSFIDALPNGDVVSVILLGPAEKTKAVVRCAPITTATKTEIRQKLSGIKFGTNGSDGLTMLGCIQDALMCPGSAKSLPFVFIFSDFEYFQPGKGYVIPAASNWENKKNTYNSILTKLENTPLITSILLHNPRQKNNYLPQLKSVFGEITEESVTGKNLLSAHFNSLKANIKKKRILKVVKGIAKLQNMKPELINKNGKTLLKQADSLVYSQIILDQQSLINIDKILNTKRLISWLPEKPSKIKVSGTLIAAKYVNEVGDELKNVTLNDTEIEITMPSATIPWWLANPIIVFLIITLYQIISVVKKRRFIGDISFYPPKGFQGSFKNIDSNLSNISNAIIGENVSDSSFGKAIDVKNNLGANTQFTMKAKKKFFGSKVIEIKSLSGFALEVISVEKKIRIVSPGTNSKCIKPGSVWRVNNVEVTMPRVR